MPTHEQNGVTRQRAKAKHKYDRAVKARKQAEHAVDVLRVKEADALRELNTASKAVEKVGTGL